MESIQMKKETENIQTGSKKSKNDNKRETGKRRWRSKRRRRL